MTHSISCKESFLDSFGTNISKLTNCLFSGNGRVVILIVSHTGKNYFDWAISDWAINANVCTLNFGPPCISIKHQYLNKHYLKWANTNFLEFFFGRRRGLNPTVAHKKNSASVHRLKLVRLNLTIYKILKYNVELIYVLERQHFHCAHLAANWERGRVKNELCTPGFAAVNNLQDLKEIVKLE